MLFREGREAGAGTRDGGNTRRCEGRADSGCVCVAAAAPQNLKPADMLERLNEEIQRRRLVVRSFSDEASCRRRIRTLPAHRRFLKPFAAAGSQFICPEQQHFAGKRRRNGIDRIHRATAEKRAGRRGRRWNAGSVPASSRGWAPLPEQESEALPAGVLRSRRVETHLRNPASSWRSMRAWRPAHRLPKRQGRRVLVVGQRMDPLRHDRDGHVPAQPGGNLGSSCCVFTRLPGAGMRRASDRTPGGNPGPGKRSCRKGGSTAPRHRAGHPRAPPWLCPG